MGGGAASRQRAGVRREVRHAHDGSRPRAPVGARSGHFTTTGNNEIYRDGTPDHTKGDSRAWRKRHSNANEPSSIHERVVCHRAAREIGCRGVQGVRRPPHVRTHRIRSPLGEVATVFVHDDGELHNKPAHAVPLASARQHPESQKGNQAHDQTGHSPERAVDCQCNFRSRTREAGCGVWWCAMAALGIKCTWFIIVLSRDRAPRSAQGWCLGPPLQASAVHVRSRLCFRFFGVAPLKKGEKGGFV